MQKKDFEVIKDNDVGLIGAPINYSNNIQHPGEENFNVIYNEKKNKERTEFNLLCCMIPPFQIHLANIHQQIL